MDPLQRFPLVADAEIGDALRAYLVGVEEAETREAVVYRYDDDWMVYLY